MLNYEIARYDKATLSPLTDIDTLTREYFSQHVKRLQSLLVSGPNQEFKNAKISIESAQVVDHISASDKANSMIKNGLIMMSTFNASYYVLVSLVLKITQKQKKLMSEFLAEETKPIADKFNFLDIDLTDINNLASLGHAIADTNERISKYPWFDNVLNSTVIRNLKTGELGLASKESIKTWIIDHPRDFNSDGTVATTKYSFNQQVGSFAWDILYSLGLFAGMVNTEYDANILRLNFAMQKKARDLVKKIYNAVSNNPGAKSITTQSINDFWQNLDNWTSPKIETLSDSEDTTFGQVINAQTNQPVNQKIQEYLNDAWIHAVSSN